jgi:hypothetical protein
LGGTGGIFYHLTTFVYTPCAIFYVVKLRLRRDSTPLLRADRMRDGLRGLLDVVCERFDYAIFKVKSVILLRDGQPDRGNDDMRYYGDGDPPRPRRSADYTRQPQDATVTVGDSVTLSVVASSPDGGTLGYQWFSGWRGDRRRNWCELHMGYRNSRGV